MSPGAGAEKPSDAVAAIERELASIWSVPDPSTGIAKVRASTLNYVAACGPAALDELRAMTDQLAETHAGRVLLLWVDGRLPPWAVTHEVSGVCRPSAGTSVCNDRVEIGFGAVAAERAASIVRSLTLSEIPIVAEIAGGAPSMLAYALAGVAQRLVVDSRGMRLAPITELFAKCGGPIADRAWVRAFSWRDLVARFFDEHPSQAATISRVRITRARAPSGGADPAHLLLGWLSSRLGWTEIGRDGARREDGGSIEVSVEDAAPGLAAAGELTSVAIDAGEGTGAIECAVAREGGGTEAVRDVRWCLHRRAAGCTDVERRMALGQRDETWVLVKALESSEGDRAYREAAFAGARWEAWWGA